MLRPTARTSPPSGWSCCARSCESWSRCCLHISKPSFQNHESCRAKTSSSPTRRFASSKRPVTTCPYEKHAHRCQEWPRRGGDQGARAESLLGVPVRPAWGKGFGWGGFSKHLWNHLPKKAHGITRVVP